MANEIERLIQLDEQETARQHERVALLSLTAAVIEALPDALIVVDVQGKIVLVNERTEFMFGYPRSDLIGRPVEMLMPARTRQIHRYRTAASTISSTLVRTREQWVLARN